MPISKLHNYSTFICITFECRALGHGASRGKIYYAHPELFKVCLEALILYERCYITLTWHTVLTPRLKPYICF